MTAQVTLLVATVATQSSMLLVDPNAQRQSSSTFSMKYAAFDDETWIKQQSSSSRVKILPKAGNLSTTMSMLWCLQSSRSLRRQKRSARWMMRIVGRRRRGDWRVSTRTSIVALLQDMLTKFLAIQRREQNQEGRTSPRHMPPPPPPPPQR